MIQLTEQQLTELLHKATGNVKDFVCDNKGWISENLPKGAINKNCISQRISNNEVALKAFVEEYVEAFEDGQGSDTALYRQAKSLL